MQATTRWVWLAALVACSGEIEDFGADPDGGASLDAPVLTIDGSLVVDAPVVIIDGGAPGPLLGDYKLTYYYVTEEQHWAGDGGVDDTGLYDPSCNLLAMVPAAFARSLSIEGTGRLSDGRVLNYSGPCPCATTPCYRFVDAQHPWGSGAGNRALVPFRSVAIDRDVLEIGRRYWVAELAGVAMPGEAPLGGFVHDGCVSADDTGGGIDGQHIDFFSALRGYYLALDRALGLDEVTLYEGGNRCR